MRFLHLADLHLGKRVHEVSMLENQRDILVKILEIVKQYQVDAVLIAGDIYDKQIPPAEAVTLLSDFLGGLAQRKVQTFVISGNHDSAERISFGAELMNMSGVHMAKPFEGIPEHITLQDDYGDIHIHMLPFIKPALVRRYYPEADIASYDDAMKVVMEHTNINADERNILLAHQFVRGGETCESEELSVGGIDEISAGHFSRFDYVALGHLHGPQKIGSESIRYAGTPLKYSFSEVHHKKSALIVELKEKGMVSFEQIPLIPLHDLREIEGTYMEVTAKDYYQKIPKDDYLRIILKDEDDVPNALGKLRSIYPHIMRLEYDNARTRKNNILTGIEKVEEKSPLALFEEFYELQNNRTMSEEQRDFVSSLMEEIWNR